ncbi:MAG: energy transducer TonB [Thiobacillus sp.]
MANPQSSERWFRLTGLFIVLVAHGALLYGLWHARILPPPTAAATLFVSLLKDPPQSAPPKPQPPKPKPRPVKLAQSIQPPPQQQVVSQTPIVLPSEPVAPAPPPAQPRIKAAPVEHVPPAAPPRPAGPITLSGDLAIACPQRTPPAYPAFSRRLGEAGKTVLRVELDEKGQVDHATVTTSSGYARLDEAALSAVRSWHCTPAKHDGVAVRAVAIQPFNFVFEGR